MYNILCFIEMHIDKLEIYREILEHNFFKKIL